MLEIFGDTTQIYTDLTLETKELFTKFNNKYDVDSRCISAWKESGAVGRDWSYTRNQSLDPIISSIKDSLWLTGTGSLKQPTRSYLQTRTVPSLSPQPSLQLLPTLSLLAPDKRRQ